jgi:hypothetical protein
MALEWEEVYSKLTGRPPVGDVDVGLGKYGTNVFDVRLHNNGHKALYIEGPGVNHLFIPPGSDYKPYAKAKCIEVTGDLAATVLNILEHPEPIEGGHE